MTRPRLRLQTSPGLDQEVIASNGRNHSDSGTDVETSFSFDRLIDGADRDPAQSQCEPVTSDVPVAISETSRADNFDGPSQEGLEISPEHNMVEQRAAGLEINQ